MWGSQTLEAALAAGNAAPRALPTDGGHSPAHCGLAEREPRPRPGLQGPLAGRFHRKLQDRWSAGCTGADRAGGAAVLGL